MPNGIAIPFIATFVEAASPFLGALAAPIVAKVAHALGIDDEILWLAKRGVLGIGPMALTVIVDQARSADELLARPDARHISEALETDVQLARFQIDQLARVRPNQLGAPISLPRLTTPEDARRWYTIISQSFGAEGAAGVQAASWANAHYRAELRRMQGQSLLEQWGAPPAWTIDPPPEEEPIDDPGAGFLEVPRPFPAFSHENGLLIWFNEWNYLSNIGRIHAEDWAAILAHYQAEAARLATAPTNGDIIVPRPGEVAGAIESADITAGLMGALGISAAGGLTAAGTALFQQMGNARHRGALGCTGTTAATMLAGVARAALPLAIPTVLLTTDTGRALIDKVGGQFFDLILTGADLPEPMTLGQAPEAASRLMVEKMALGSSAHLWAASMEAMAPMKNLGLHQLAAGLADLAGFERLGNFTLGSVEEHAVGRPMRQWAGRKYRTTLPSVQDIILGYAKREIPPGPIPEGSPPRAAYSEPPEGAEDWTFYELMSRHGYADPFIRMMSHHVYRDPSFGHLIRLGQYYNPAIAPETKEPTPFVERWFKARPWLFEQLGIDEETWRKNWWLWYKAANIGLEPADVRVVVATLQRAVLRREQTLFLDATTRLYRDGFIDKDQLRPLTEEAWGIIPGPDGEMTFSGDPIAARIRATELRTDYHVRAEIRDLTLRAVKVGVMTEDDARRTLRDAGMPAHRIDLEILRQKLGLLPGIRLTIPLADEAEDAGTADEVFE